MGKGLKLRICLVVLAAGFAAHGASVRAVAPNNEALLVLAPDPLTPLAIGEPICLFENNKPFACGSVVKKIKGGDVVRLAWSKRKLAAGIVLRITKPKRVPASLPGAVIYDPSVAARPPSGPVSRQSTFVAAGAMGGGVFIAPSLHAQFKVGGRSRLGLLGSYSSGSDEFSKASLLGIMVSFQIAPFATVPNFTLQTLAGVYLLSSTVDGTGESATLITGALMLEWRQPLGSSLFFSAAAGGQYTTQAQLLLADVQVAGFLPVVLLQLGMGF